MMKYSSGTFLKGLLLGLVVPVLGAIIAYGVIDLLAEANWGAAKKEINIRTILLVGIIFNLLPFHFFLRRGQYNTIRGIMTATMVYALGWLIYFTPSFF